MEWKAIVFLLSILRIRAAMGIEFLLKLRNAHSGPKLAHRIEEVIAAIFEHFPSGL